MIIDDFGLKPLRNNKDEYLHDIIAGRYETHATIVTSNLDFSEWQDAFPQQITWGSNHRSTTAPCVPAYFRW